MRILQVVSHYVPAYRFGGPLQVAHQLGRALVAQGHEVTVCTTNQQDPRHDLVVAIDEPVDVDGVRVFYEPVVLSRKWGYSPRMAKRLANEIRENDVVLVHAHYQFAHWMGARLARREQKPYVVFAHSSLRRAALRSSSRWIKECYLRLMEWRNLKHARFIAFNAEEEMEDSLFCARGEVIPSGIDPSCFEPAPRAGLFRQAHPELEGKTCFLFLGRIDIGQKAVDQIVKGFSRIAAVRPEAHLVLAGPSEGQDAGVIRRMIEERQLTCRVTMTGLVSGAEKATLLRDADVFLLPSHFEGLSIALLEAMYFGLPVILSRHAGLCRKVERNQCGLVIEPVAESIAEAMSEMLHPERRRVLGLKSREIVLKEHTWDKIAELLIRKLR